MQHHVPQKQKDQPMRLPRLYGGSFILTMCAIALLPGPAHVRAAPGLRFSVTFPHAVRRRPLQGRLYVILAANGGRQPRFEVNDSIETAEIFGHQCNQWKAGEPEIIGGHLGLQVLD